MTCMVKSPVCHAANIAALGFDAWRCRRSGSATKEGRRNKEASDCRTPIKKGRECGPSVSC
jgi:hypothetical protein